MVVGLQRFREHFRSFDNAYVLIGGAACEAWMLSNALTFRKTRDLDIVLVVEAVDSRFVGRFRDFVEAGDYEERVRQQTGEREYFRFVKPKTADYPFMLELFSRAPGDLELSLGQKIVPVAVDASFVSLSAILMDEGYYELVVATRYEADGVPMVGVDGLIPLKARAWQDLKARSEAGEKRSLPTQCRSPASPRPRRTGPRLPVASLRSPAFPFG
ncbi:MAG: hypothetical protein HY898_22985 [Deltaproteobacteria bacterium]|nr:hypothetical protein [Deltaproteobacteria bacterium]